MKSSDHARLERSNSFRNHQGIDPSSWNQKYPRKGFISTVFTKIAKLSRLEKVVV
jgi:hypothetical protein